MRLIEAFERLLQDFGGRALSWYLCSQREPRPRVPLIAKIRGMFR